MKKLLLTIATAAMFAACSNNNDTATTDQLQAADTTGLSEFQNWKKEQDMVVNMPAMPSTPIDATDLNAPVDTKQSAKPKTRVIYKYVPAKSSAPKYLRTVADPTPDVPAEPVNVPVSSGQSRDAVYRTGAGPNESTGAGTSEGSDAGISKPVVTSEPQPAKKEGWSKAAKGAVIGGASGAVLGAIIGKNKGMGAVIGGIAGAAGGYIIGRSKDKKDGRY